MGLAKNKYFWMSLDPPGSSSGPPGIKKPLDDTETWSRDVADHMAKLHKERKIVDPVIIAANRIKDLRTILKKL